MFRYLVLVLPPSKDPERGCQRWGRGRPDFHHDDVRRQHVVKWAYATAGEGVTRVADEVLARMCSRSRAPSPTPERGPSFVHAEAPSEERPYPPEQRAEPGSLSHALKPPSPVGPLHPASRPPGHLAGDQFSARAGRNALSPHVRLAWRAGVCPPRGSSNVNALRPLGV